MGEGVNEGSEYAKGGCRRRSGRGKGGRSGSEEVEEAQTQYQTRNGCSKYRART